MSKKAPAKPKVSVQAKPKKGILYARISQENVDLLHSKAKAANVSLSTYVDSMVTQLDAQKVI